MHALSALAILATGASIAASAAVLPPAICRAGKLYSPWGGACTTTPSLSAGVSVGARVNANGCHQQPDCNSVAIAAGLTAGSLVPYCARSPTVYVAYDGKNKAACAGLDVNIIPVCGPTGILAANANANINVGLPGTPAGTIANPTGKAAFERALASLYIPNALDAKKLWNGGVTGVGLVDNLLGGLTGAAGGFHDCLNDPIQGCPNVFPGIGAIGPNTLNSCGIKKDVIYFLKGGSLAASTIGCLVSKVLGTVFSGYGCSN